MSTLTNFEGIHCYIILLDCLCLGYANSAYPYTCVGEAHCGYTSFHKYVITIQRLCQDFSSLPFIYARSGRGVAAACLAIFIPI